MPPSGVPDAGRWRAGIRACLTRRSGWRRAGCVWRFIRARRVRAVPRRPVCYVQVVPRRPVCCSASASTRCLPAGWEGRNVGFRRFCTKAPTSENASLPLFNHRFFEWRKFDENRHSAWRVPTVPEAGGLGVHFGCGPHWPQPAVFWKHMQDARRLTMCYACSLCNRCGRADEMKARFGKRRCPSCNAIATDNAARTCARCGATLPPPFPDPPASVPHRPA